MATLMWISRGHRALFYTADLLGQRGLDRMDDAPVLRSRKSTNLAVEPTTMTSTSTSTAVIQPENAATTTKETPEKPATISRSTSTSTSLSSPGESRSSNENNNDVPKKKIIQETLLDLGITGFNPDIVWESLIQEGEAILKRPQEQEPKASTKDNNNNNNSTSTQRLIALEVGVHRPRQCLQAARAGFQAVCVEPSPKNFPICQQSVNQQSPEIKERVHLHQKVASSTTGEMLEFLGAGSTGDHVGSVDVWNMKVQEPQADTDSATKDPNMVQVPSVRLDDLLKNDMKLGVEERVFLAKIDTQGHEPEVFEGLSEWVFQKRQIDYILFEYWPKGMDIMNTGDTSRMTCVAAKLLHDLHAANYTLYALPNVGHPKCPQSAKNAMNRERAPFHDFRENCLYYYQLERRFATDEYKMGYWSDMLAVAPGTPLLENPLTTVGQALRREQEARIASKALELLQKE